MKKYVFCFTAMLALSLVMAPNAHAQRSIAGADDSLRNLVDDLARKDGLSPQDIVVIKSPGSKRAMSSCTELEYSDELGYWSAGTCFLIVDPEYLARFDADGQTFVIGHELGHILNYQAKITGMSNNREELMADLLSVYATNPYAAINALNQMQANRNSDCDEFYQTLLASSGSDLDAVGAYNVNCYGELSPLNDHPTYRTRILNIMSLFPDYDYSQVTITLSYDHPEFKPGNGGGGGGGDAADSDNSGGGGGGGGGGDSDSQGSNTNPAQPAEPEPDPLAPEYNPCTGANPDLYDSNKWYEYYAYMMDHCPDNIFDPE